MQTKNLSDFTYKKGIFQDREAYGKVIIGLLNRRKKSVDCDNIILSSDSLFCVKKTGNLRNISNTGVLLTCDQETFQSGTRIHRCFDG